ncbi:hypothetical protein EDC96DRAFT_434261 [Choanephora cucurbitarum]|nr:hypothetical protein EDC96DRAFT_434261 [Choanephora cucurbitarum]
MSYIASLNLLNTDSPSSDNEQVFQDDLALWANAQFNFDTSPGSAIHEEHNNEAIFDTLTKLTQLGKLSTLLKQYFTLIYLFAVQPNHLPRIAPAPGPMSGIQLLEQQGKKRALEEDMTPDDDKRRRNTAASARFRMKKKLREQALEKTSKELADNVEKLEERVKELEMEAKWLRALVLEKDPHLLNEDKTES